MEQVTFDEYSGYGDGYGNGDGDGDGDGYGYGNGYGDGYGNGDGDGDGDGNSSACESYYAAIASQPALNGNSDGIVAFWNSDNFGMPANGGSGMTAVPGMVQEVDGPLRSKCGQGQLHATFNPHKWKGSRLWLVALHGEVGVEEDKLWALKRTIIREIT